MTGDLVNAPRVVVAGASSDCGKTTVAMGLMAALSQDKVVQPFKVGPDYIDPSHHTQICGKPSRNLDTFMMGREKTRESFARAQHNVDISVIEGVMGLYDGLGPNSRASTADVARVLGAPVVLVVDVRGMSQSAAALVKGYKDYGDVNVAGVILNHVGSKNHQRMVEKVMERIGVPVVGALPRLEEMSIPSRHLGLHMAHENQVDTGRLARITREYVDLEALTSIAEATSPITPAPSRTVDSDNVRVGVAHDPAFCFYYEDGLDELRRRGAKLVFFSPLAGETPEVDGVYLGGGYPELFAKELSESKTTRWLRERSMDGLPVYGECGGLMYLGQTLETDKAYEMCGVLPAHTRMTDRLVALGYVEGHARGVFEGRVRGHEFHYSETWVDGDARFTLDLSRGKGIEDGMDGLREYNVVGSYTHLHFYSTNPAGFLELCRSHE